MIKRKINKVGTGTYTVSLPSKWIKKNKLKQGEELILKEEPEKITISKNLLPPSLQTKKIRYNSKDFLIRYVVGEYIVGVDDLKMKFDSYEMFNEINNELRYLLGWEIISQDLNSCELKNIASPHLQDFKKVVGRLFLLIEDFGKETYNHISKQKYDALPQVMQIENTITRLSNFSLRILNKQIYKSNAITNVAFGIVLNLERAADSIKYLCNQFHKNPPQKLSKANLTLFKEVISLISLSNHIFITRTEENIKNFEQKREKIQEQIETKLWHEKKGDIILLNYSLNLLHELRHLIYLLIYGNLL